jgi:hypothetical protein
LLVNQAKDRMRMAKLTLTVAGRQTSSSLAVLAEDLVIAGWAGRDKEKMEHHIAELEALGVARPLTTPTYYRVAAARLTTSGQIEVCGGDSSGEAESLLIAVDGRLYIGVGSDHTDRKLETYGVTVSKQVCDKPIAAIVWPFEEVADHWDDLILRSYATIDGTRQLYQEGTLAALLPPAEIIRGHASGGTLRDGTVIFGGTMPAIGGIRPATCFEGELEDPILGRRISFGYDVKLLPVRG